MASTDAGGNSPPDPGNGNSNNGNISPTGLNALLESISDINLGLLAVSNRFLSAKNSVELHRNRARNRFFPYRSLPTVLGSEQPHHVPESESGPSARGASSSENVSQTSVRAHHGRNVRNCGGSYWYFRSYITFNFCLGKLGGSPFKLWKTDASQPKTEIVWSKLEHYPQLVVDDLRSSGNIFRSQYPRFPKRASQ